MRSNYLRLFTVDEAAVDHPKVNFVIAHCGNPWIEAAAEPYVEAYKRAIPKEHWRAVSHDNAVRVFKFPAK